MFFNQLYFFAAFANILLAHPYTSPSGEIKNKDSKTVIEIQLTPEVKAQLLPNVSTTKELELEFTPCEYLDLYPQWTKLKTNKVNNNIKFVLSAEKPILLNSVFWDYARIITPGDSVVIKLDKGKSIYSGIGKDGIQLQDKLEEILRLPSPTKNSMTIQSLSDYLSWKAFLDRQVELITHTIDLYKGKIPAFSYNYIKSTFVSVIENNRCNTFYSLCDLAAKSNPAKLSFSDLADIWDSTQHTPSGTWLRSLDNFHGYIDYYFNYNKLKVRRKYNFDFSSDTLKSKKPRVGSYYRQAREDYKGLVRERLLQQLISEEIITEVGPADNFTMMILQDYYSLPGFAGYKQWMKDYYDLEIKLKPGKKVPTFVFSDNNGNWFTKENLKGKAALLFFWTFNSAACTKMGASIQALQRKLSRDTNIVFMSICVDKNDEKWKEYKKNTHDPFISLFVSDLDDSTNMLKRLNVWEYPKLILLDGEGKIIADPVPDPENTMDQAKLTGLIVEETAAIAKQQHALKNDGPYVLYSNNEHTSYTVENDKVSFSTDHLMTVHTDVPGILFTTRVRPHHTMEPSVYARPEKLLALSDIEGNFYAFRLLLQANKIIDENFKWIFGSGHLVFAGDMFDRGLQVTECLWLIYSLEEQAKAAGGYVHFILGNHEIMNMQGNYHYTKQKYKDNAVKIGKSLLELYNNNSELGRWLRSKNIMEKIGHLLFVHGGISPQVYRMPLDIREMNNLCRPYYAGKLDSSNYELLTLFNDKRLNGQDRTSPFWFRGYYGDIDNANQIPDMSQIDSTLQKFNVSHIITGHTIVADTISTKYENKVINIDTHHASGKSEALLLEDNRFYRVNTQGQKFLLAVTDTFLPTVTSIPD